MGNTGDVRLYGYYSSQGERTYIEVPNKEEFKSRFKAWVKDDNTRPEQFSPAVKALATIHANLTYLSDFVNSGEPLQFEHIYPKSRIRSVDTGKKVKTLYEVDDSDKYKKVIEESVYPSTDDFEVAFRSLEENNFGIINQRILKRSYKVADAIVNKLLDTKF